jgi:hypothetical protein
MHIMLQFIIPVEKGGEAGLFFYLSPDSVFYNGSIIFLEAASAASVHSFLRTSGSSFILFIETGAIGLPGG